MANAGSKPGGGSSKAPPAADQEFDPKYEWQENPTSFILRVHLSGFRKQDFRVQVDGAGRLTVRGQRSDAAANARHSRFSKVFQLPSTSNLDDISGRFEAGVLTLTVPKRLLPASQQQAKAPPQEQDAKEHEQAKKPKDDAKPQDAAAAASKKPAAGQQMADAKSGKPEPEQQHKAAAPPPPAVRKEEGKPRAGAAAPPAAADTNQAATPKPAPPPPETSAAAPPPPLAATTQQVATTKPAPPPQAGAAAPAAETKQQAVTPKPAPPPPPPQADAERKAVDPESLAETVKRRTEEDRAKAAAEAETERQRKECRGFKERVAEELQGLAGSEWAEGLVETVKRNKEVIAVAVAAFSLGVFVSSRLLSRSSRN